MSQLGFALFGLGRAGNIHFNNLLINPATNLKYIVDEDTKKVAEKVQQYGLNCQAISPAEVSRVYNDQEVSGVVICTPTYTHEEYVKASLQAGKGVFCEKPIADELMQTWSCYNSAEKAGKPLICSFNRRFDPGLMEIHERVNAGEIGAIMTIHAVARDHPLPPMEYLRISGGIFHDCAVHDIDLICWILGEYPSSVCTEAFAQDDRIKDMDDVDTVAILLRFPSNKLATINISRHACYGYDQRLEVFGMAGMLRNENQQPTRLEISKKDGVQTDPLMWSFPQRYRDSYFNAMQHFVDVLKGVEKPAITGNESMATSIIATACEESFKKGEKISLNLAQYRKPTLVCPK